MRCFSGVKVCRCFNEKTCYKAQVKYLCIVKLNFSIILLFHILENSLQGIPKIFHVKIYVVLTQLYVPEARMTMHL